MTIKYVCYDDFNKVVRSNHNTLAGAVKEQQKRDKNLRNQGYDGIHCVMISENGTLRNPTNSEAEEILDLQELQ